MVAKNVVMMRAESISTDTAISCKKIYGQHGGQKCSPDEGIKCFHTHSHVMQEKVMPTWWPEM